MQLGVFTFDHIESKHSVSYTVTIQCSVPYWVLPVYVELIRAVLADDDRDRQATIILTK
jgi:hypothetical protein